MTWVQKKAHIGDYYGSCTFFHQFNHLASAVSLQMGGLTLWIVDIPISAPRLGWWIVKH